MEPQVVGIRWLTSQRSQLRQEPQAGRTRTSTGKTAVRPRYRNDSLTRPAFPFHRVRAGAVSSALMIVFLFLLFIMERTINAASPTGLRFLFLFAVVFAALYAVGWQLVWVGLAALARAKFVPSSLRSKLRSLIGEKGSRLSRQLLWIGAGGIAAGSFLFPAAAADTPEALLWPGTVAEQSETDQEASGPEDGAELPSLWPDQDSAPSAEEDSPGTEVAPGTEVVAPEATPEAPLGNEAVAAPPPGPVLAPPKPLQPSGNPKRTADVPTRGLPVTESPGFSAARGAGKSLFASPHVTRLGTRIGAGIRNGAAARVPTAPAETSGTTTYTVAPGDCLWDIAAFHLGPDRQADTEVDAAWRVIYTENRTLVGEDPDLIHPGMVLSIPAL